MGVCELCGSNEGKEVIVKDYNMGGTESFTYWQCSNCGCMSLINKPVDMSKYYGKAYYSFSLKQGKVKTLMKRRDVYEVRKTGIIGEFMSKFIPRPAYSVISEFNDDARILDVGCGDGYLLYLLREMGYKNLYGCDRFMDNRHDANIDLIKGGVDVCEGEYDLIMFNHSFEHMDEPLKVLKCASEKLSKNGKISISIPVANSNAYKKYGKYWVQLDAPRHFFIHSVKSIEMLTKQVNLKIENTIFDSSAFQYICSEQYKNGKNGDYRRTWKGIIEYGLLSLFKYSSLAKRDNELKQGDQATFVLSKV